MAAIFQIRRGTSNVSLTEGELYLHQGSGSLQFGSGSTKYNTLTLDAPVKGDINLIGNITASNAYFTGDVAISGNLFLGNNSSDNISALGVFTSNLSAGTTNTYDIGSTTSVWRNVYATSISGAIAATNGVVSGSSQIISILTSLNTFSGSQLTQNGALATISSSLISTASNHEQRLGQIESKSGSYDTRFNSLATISGSLISTASANTISVTNLNSFSSSQLTENSNLATITGSLISTASANVLSIASLNSYTSSLQQAITASGANLTINGNLTVKGTTTQIDSTTIQIGDNIIELNGTGIANGGLLVKDPTGGSTLSGSLLWDSTNDYWKGGTLSNESKLLRAGGDSVISASAQLTELNSFTSSQLTQNGALATISGSLISTASANTISLTNLNSFSSSQLTQNTALATISGSLILTASANTISITNINTITASLNTSVTNINSFTSSQLTQNTTLGSYTASVNQTTSSLNSYTASANAWSGTIDTRFTTLGTYTASVNQTTSSLNSYTASISTSFGQFSSSYAADSASFDYRIDTLDPGNLSGNLLAIQQTTASLNTFSASAKISITNLEAATSSYETNGRGIVSGSSQITYASISSIPSGIVSGAAQIPALLPSGVLSGSSQVLGGSGVASGSYETTGRSIVSSSAQIVLLLPAGVVSGSSQIITSNAITLGTHTTGNYVATIAGTANQITVAGSGLETAAITLSTPQDIHTSANVQFNSIGLGTAASGVAGEVRATGDVTAFYSSDIRLKENIQPIQNALEKVESISGNTYDWKEGFDEIHSHKGNDVGVIAQEIEEILPQIVTNRDNGFKAVQYEKIIPLLIEAIKELSAKIKDLENK